MVHRELVSVFANKHNGRHPVRIRCPTASPSNTVVYAVTMLVTACDALAQAPRRFSDADGAPSRLIRLSGIAMATSGMIDVLGGETQCAPRTWFFVIAARWVLNFETRAAGINTLLKAQRLVVKSEHRRRLRNIARISRKPDGHLDGGLRVEARSGSESWRE